MKETNGTRTRSKWPATSVSWHSSTSLKSYMGVTVSQPSNKEMFSYINNRMYKDEME